MYSYLLATVQGQKKKEKTISAPHSTLNCHRDWAYFISSVGTGCLAPLSGGYPSLIMWPVLRQGAKVGCDPPLCLNNSLIVFLSAANWSLSSLCVCLCVCACSLPWAVERRQTSKNRVWLSALFIVISGPVAQQSVIIDANKWHIRSLICSAPPPPPDCNPTPPPLTQPWKWPTGCLRDEGIMTGRFPSFF